jgi:hypothetical protein
MCMCTGSTKEKEWQWLAGWINILHRICGITCPSQVRLSWVSRYSCICVGMFRTRFPYFAMFPYQSCWEFCGLSSAQLVRKKCSTTPPPPPPKKSTFIVLPCLPTLGYHCLTALLRIAKYILFGSFHAFPSLSFYQASISTEICSKAQKATQRKKNLKFSIYFKETLSRDGWPSQKKNYWLRETIHLVFKHIKRQLRFNLSCKYICMH